MNSCKDPLPDGEKSSGIIGGMADYTRLVMAFPVWLPSIAVTWGSATFNRNQSMLWPRLPRKERSDDVDSKMRVTLPRMFSRGTKPQNRESSLLLRKSPMTK